MADFGVTEVLAASATVATLAGAGISYMGAQSTAAATSAASEYNAKISANNQIMADNAAANATAAGKVEQQQKANQENLLIGQEKAGLAANGIDTGSGSAVTLLSDTKAAGELDQLTIANNAAKTAIGFTNQGINYGNQAVVDQASSAAALQGGALKADASLVSAAGQVSSQWYNYNTKIASSSSGSP